MNAPAQAKPNQVAVQPREVPRASLIARVAAKFNVDAERMMVTLKSTAFRQGVNDPEVTNEQMMALLVVADQYGLNPWTKELYAFPDKHKGIVPIVGLDGWARIVNEHEQYDGVDFNYGPQSDKHKGAPEWIECSIFRKDRSHPTVVREVLIECYRSTGPWDSHPSRMLRHKAFMQAGRLAFGFVGIYDEDEAQRIIEGTATYVPAERSTAVRDINAAITGKPAPATIEHQPGEKIPAPAIDGESQREPDLVAAAEGKTEAAAKSGKKQEATGPAYGEVRAALDNAKDRDAVDAAEAMVDGLPANFHGELHDLAKTRRAALAK